MAKNCLGLKSHHKMFQDKFHGLTVVGARGQIVIPAAARKELDLKAGDQLLVVSKFGKLLALVKADQLEAVLKSILGVWSGLHQDKLIQTHAKYLVSTLTRSKNK
jgi:AbrB family looped-hinge helix DNA binding protein